MEIEDVVKKLIGNINPVGETYEDNRRFENLKVWGEVAHFMAEELFGVSRNRDSSLSSKMTAGKYAQKQLLSIRDYIEE